MRLPYRGFPYRAIGSNGCSGAVGIYLVALGVKVEIPVAWITTPAGGRRGGVPRSFGQSSAIQDRFRQSIGLCFRRIIALFPGRAGRRPEGTVAAAVCVGLLTKLFRKRCAGWQPTFPRLPDEAGAGGPRRCSGKTGAPASGMGGGGPGAAGAKRSGGPVRRCRWGSLSRDGRVVAKGAEKAEKAGKKFKKGLQWVESVVR